jgi:pimeloyl-ACP methyl ester carboxylesterase
MSLIIVIVIAALLGVSAIYTQIYATSVERAHPPSGRLVEVDGIRLHVFDRGETNPDLPTVVLIHGASGNLEDMRMVFGDAFKDRRVIMIDRPGLGWSDPVGVGNDRRLSRQVTLIHDLLERLDAGRVVMAGHSLAGALVANYALTYPDRLSGIVLISPVLYPWPGGIALYYNIFATPLVGELFAYTIAAPLAQLLVGPAMRSVFAPQPVVPDYRERAAIDLAFRPRAFLENARDVAMLNSFVTAQSPRYGEITLPTAIVTGDTDSVVSPQIHSRAMAARLPNATLTVMQNVGHMPHHYSPDRIIAAVKWIDDSKLAADAKKPDDKLLAPPVAEPQPLTKP